MTERTISRDFLTHLLFTGLLKKLLTSFIWPNKSSKWTFSLLLYQHAQAMPADSPLDLVPSILQVPASIKHQACGAGTHSQKHLSEHWAICSYGDTSTNHLRCKWALSRSEALFTCHRWKAKSWWYTWPLILSLSFHRACFLFSFFKNKSAAFYCPKEEINDKIFQCL